MKLAVYQEMIVRNMTQRQLAGLIGCDERQVRRILDLDHESKMSQVEAALSALGLRVAIEVEPVNFLSQFAH
jgi:antitoxin HicB